MTPPLQIVIGPDGTVLAVSGPLLPALVDSRLDDCAGVSRSIREAGQAVLDRLRTSGARVASMIVEADDTGSPVQLIAIEAVGLRRSATEIRQLLTSKLDVLASQARAAGVTLRIDVASDVPEAVRLDADKVSWAVTTLVGNALRYVQTGSRRLGGQAIDVRATVDAMASALTIAVHDDGPGIPADTINRLFLRDSLNVRGAGLALLLIRDIMLAHGGTVDVASNTDPVRHGTVIRLTFPIR